MEDIKANAHAVRVVVLYHGGEPLLNKQMISMIKEIKNCGGIFVKTVTNGMVFTDAIIDKLIESGLDVIEFSLDGESPAQNNVIRKNCDYYKVIDNIKKLIQRKRQKGFQTPGIYISTTQFVNQNLAISKQKPKVPDFLRREFMGEFEEEITDFKATFAMRWPHMNVTNEYAVLVDPDDYKTRNHCDHVINTVTIRANGDVVPCCYDITSRAVMGNINKNSLLKIWNNDQYYQLRQRIEAKQYIPLCANCNVVKPQAYLVRKK